MNRIGTEFGFRVFDIQWLGPGGPEQWYGQPTLENVATTYKESAEKIAALWRKLGHTQWEPNDVYTPSERVKGDRMHFTGNSNQAERIMPKEMQFDVWHNYLTQLLFAISNGATRANAPRQSQGQPELQRVSLRQPTNSFVEYHGKRFHFDAFQEENEARNENKRRIVNEFVRNRNWSLPGMPSKRVLATAQRSCAKWKPKSKDC